MTYWPKLCCLIPPICKRGVSKTLCLQETPEHPLSMLWHPFVAGKSMVSKKTKPDNKSSFSGVLSLWKQGPLWFQFGVLCQEIQLGGQVGSYGLGRRTGEPPDRPGVQTSLHISQESQRSLRFSVRVQEMPGARAPPSDPSSMRVPPHQSSQAPDPLCPLHASWSVVSLPVFLFKSVH